MPDPVRVLCATLESYLKTHGRRVLSIAESTGQDRVRIELRALYRYYDPSAEYPRLVDVLSALSSRELEELEKMGIKLMGRGEYAVLEVPLEHVEKVLESGNQSYGGL